jgi:hypothetical protein
MAANRKLTAVIRGRAVARVEPAPDDGGPGARVLFDDGSVMTVALQPGATAPAGGGARVRGVRQAGTAFTLDLEGGTSLAFETREPTSSVILRDAKGTLEYAD